MNPVVKTIESRLRQWQLARALGDKPKAYSLSNEIYNIIFTEQGLDLWDERTLLGLEQVLRAHPPDRKAYGKEVDELLRRARRVRSINDVFFRVLDPETSLDDIVQALADFVKLPDSVTLRLVADGKLMNLREASATASSKLGTFMKWVKEALEAQPGSWLTEFQSCIQAIQDREEIGTASALLVHKPTSLGILLSVTVGVHTGSGKIQTIVPAAGSFETAAERARLALVNRGFLSNSQDVLLTLNLTEAEYSGGSIALATALAVYSMVRNYFIDPYTAFTGDINFKGGNWVLQAVEGIPQKLQAALDAGCRRVFLPKDNEPDVPPKFRELLNLVYVNDITEVLSRLSMPAISSHQGSSLEAQKTHLLKVLCVERGYQFSTKAIQDGTQFAISPPTGRDMKINIYKSGAHVPKDSERPELQELVVAIARLDTPSIPFQKVEQHFNIKEAGLRAQIREGLQKLSPVKAKDELYCEYSFQFEDGQERLVVKQFTSGTLQVQGYAGPLYKKVLDVVIPIYNIWYPNAKLKVEDFFCQLNNLGEATRKLEFSTIEEALRFPYIGTDESGKGDYFGPLVVAAVWVDAATQKELEAMGVQDSKALSDQKCRKLATRIRDLCRGKYEEVEIPPERYNLLYAQFRREGKTLNHFLAWGHARALESLLARHSSEHAVADQFGDEKYILSKLMEKGGTLRLVQTPKAERYLAVAAASILARDRFLFRLQQLSEQLGVGLPKGASPIVVDVAKTIVRRFGQEMLQKVAKVHFKTTSVVLANKNKK